MIADQEERELIDVLIENLEFLKSRTIKQEELGLVEDMLDFLYRKSTHRPVVVSTSTLPPNCSFPEAFYSAVNPDYIPKHDRNK